MCSLSGLANRGTSKAAGIWDTAPIIEEIPSAKMNVK